MIKGVVYYKNDIYVGYAGTGCDICLVSNNLKWNQEREENGFNGKFIFKLAVCTYTAIKINVAVRS